MSYTIEPLMSPHPILWRDVSAKEHKSLPFSRFYEELAPAVDAGIPSSSEDVAIFDARTAPIRVVAPLDGSHAGMVLESPVVLVGAFDPEAVVAFPRPMRAPAPIAPYEEILIQLGPAELAELEPARVVEPELAPEPEPVLLLEPELVAEPAQAQAAEERPAGQTWDTDREIDEVIQDWFDKPLPEPPADMGGEITLH